MNDNDKAGKVIMDARAVIAQVRQGNIPANWQVYFTNMDNFSDEDIFLARSILALFGLIVLLFVTAVTGEALAGRVGISIGFFLGLIIDVLFLIRIFKNLTKQRTSPRVKKIKEPFFAILPEGVVESVDSLHRDNFFWLSFPHISKMVLASQTKVTSYDGFITSRTSYWLDVYFHDGTYTDWHIDQRFGDGAYLGKSTVAAYEYYWRQQKLSTPANST